MSFYVFLSVGGIFLVLKKIKYSASSEEKHVYSFELFLHVFKHF